ncbi:MULTISPECIES: hypothetical protein [Streptomyces]|uniref:Uncharacterized protein n=1 Tax=Streptomyces doudnae TaxID=3075536 RepID=A0ABD5EY44_9ACTN|nr:MULTISPECIES: hypothetical protein [unclassified Streptomyces]MDT0439588.1 hypothetical protein [Streptomyces sp. DSM 41981]MYQ67573.1 hypothetical protein [Streptomyces sp. SID4950]
MTEATATAGARGRPTDEGVPIRPGAQPPRPTTPATPAVPGADRRERQDTGSTSPRNEGVDGA